MKTLDRRLSQLRKLVRSYGSAAVAFSGGADSTLVARIAKDELGNKTVAVTIDSPMYPASELAKAKGVAKSIGVEHVVVRVDPLGDRTFITNPPDRCYLCKRDDLTHIRRIADDHGLREVLDGSNADDRDDYRPGTKAKEEMKVRSPLAETGLTKAQVRAISKTLKLPTAHKSSSPCLASRIPYGERITTEKLRMIEEAEEFLKAKGFDDVRVRMHGDMARVEISPKDISMLASPGMRVSVTKKLRSLGFTYVSVDLEGYRMGSLNEVLRR
ncbi:MAG: ATP-dependent sacrificial sulfur transferase LarE [Euryarchaeota archaeon]|nr:ATP-dependent sacrificial sulfur transferase LarE [Euryarchaeota archaeon]